MSEQYSSQTQGLNAIFDLSFTRFVTVSVVKFVYVLGIILLGLAWLIIVISGFTNSFMSGLIAIVVGAIAAFLYLLLFRIWLELIVVIFRIGEQTSLIARTFDAQSPTGGFPVQPVTTST